MHFVRSIAVAATTLLTVGYVSTAAAESPGTSSTGKGIIGGALLGAEAVLLTEAALDVSPNWLYYVGGGVGAVGGGIGGYFIEQELSPKSNMLLLAAGMLLAIPTTVAVLSATAYEQTSDYTQDQVPTDEPTAEPIIAPPPTDTTQPPATPVDTAPSEATPTPSTPEPTPPTTTPEPTPPTTTPEPTPPTTTPEPTSQSSRKQRRRPIPPTLIAVDNQANLHLGLPAVEVRDMYSRGELQRFGLQQRSELRVPLLRVAF